MDAWTIIDAVHRLRALLRQIPGVSRSPKNSPKLRIFMDRTEIVEELRKHVQHLDQEVHSMAARSEPILGVVRWWAITKHEGQPVVSICYVVAGTVLSGPHPPYPGDPS